MATRRSNLDIPRESERNIPSDSLRRENESQKKNSGSPEPRIRDPTVTVPTTSKNRHVKSHGHRSSDNVRPPASRRLMKYIYNKEKSTFCDRTCTNWALIIGYAIMYLIFLCTYSLIFLYASLWIIRLTEVYKSDGDKTLMLSYMKNGVGLTAAPSVDTSYPLIAYRRAHSKDYEKYVKSLDTLLIKKRRKRDLNLGPCGENPYGYGDEPCIIIRINKQYNWAGKPLEENSVETKQAPIEVQNWIKRDKMLWLYCEGLNAYDKEHIGRIKYFPHPPGIDPAIFPIKKESTLPVIAVQISNFTVGLTLHIECKLWYITGPSKIDVMLYVAPDGRPVMNV